MGHHVAELAGIELSDTAENEIVVGGLQTTGWLARVHLELNQGKQSHMWAPTVYFCDPWPWAFGLLGLGGLDPFLLSINTYEEWVELHPLHH
jgi:hypothetical protein